MMVALILLAFVAGFVAGLVFQRVRSATSAVVVEVEDALPALKARALTALDEARTELNQEHVRVLTYVHNALSEL